MMKDPVCDMDVDEARTSFHSNYQGQTFYFCSAMCKEWFDRAPERFLIPLLPTSPRRRRVVKEQLRDAKNGDEMQKTSKETDL